jgi:hypothetical protein
MHFFLTTKGLERWIVGRDEHRRRDRRLWIRHEVVVPPARRMPPHRIRGRRSESPGEDEIVRQLGIVFLGRNTPTGLTVLPVFRIRTVLGPDPNRRIRYQQLRIWI